MSAPTPLYGKTGPRTRGCRPVLVAWGADPAFSSSEDVAAIQPGRLPRPPQPVGFESTAPADPGDGPELVAATVFDFATEQLESSMA